MSTFSTIAPATGLIADIGGTNARFALVDTLTGAVLRAATLSTDDHPGPVAAARVMLAEAAAAGLPMPGVGAWAVACPVLADAVDLTNHAWAFSIDATREALGLSRLTVINDFVANALAIPDLRPEDSVAIGPGGAGSADHPMVAIGPGTGLGVALLVPDGAGGWRAQATEGGHVTLAPADAADARLLDHLWPTHPHVSAERLISGDGLLLLYRTLAALEGVAARFDRPEAVSAAAMGGTDPLARAAMNRMYALLGTVAGNLVLSTGALGGVFILGGIVPATLDLFRASPFRARFEAKGRFRDYVAPVPTRVVTHPTPAFVGLARMVRAGA
ncbi:glucokinase [Roseospira visakhapatnamensis]|uniref:Glucokinase n=1 Tax=Roseospira visakhapatnamensis TaxID=390880 RepID=A0A7W6REE5_9PROT|nr:glucokinase [Roseospira visakhapatnamensis]MBB4266536.1 glucokinase [Roseospira visakhapatnamensis]